MKIRIFQSEKTNKWTIYQFFRFDVKFDYVLIKVWKKEEHFAIILFCKQSKSEIRIEKFWFSKFDFIMLVQGLQGPRLEPIILISWSLWVSINSAWRDESFELGNRSVAPLFPEKNVSTDRCVFSTYFFDFGPLRASLGQFGQV